ncbi:CRTAC1 family protein [Seonamhaeicola algicola]|uniref:CRTAC1 family protein n=1 Tax=Seonamhaeicola algicola TaxID=1719036 RepID=A0A5C7AN24_9FLAO|nr:CRTAC1 family protein [Seonamhaeicola algicola]TXE10160.1 CRTAC1 family protein [Seonamhaeicola algicola]
MNKNIKYNLWLLFGLSFFACKAQQIQDVSFFEDSEVVSFEDRSRRKFDNAVIADLDQDGWLDLLLIEHSRRVELYWNNTGKFEKGEPFIFGDTHGMTVADYNNDGLLDVLVQPGGGDGKNPRKLRAYTINLDRTISKETEFKHFEASRGRAVKFFDANNNSELDLILSAFPAKNKYEKAHFLYRKDTPKYFAFEKLLPYADRFNMRATITDFNNDNIKDFLFYGGSKIIAVQGEDNFGFTDVTNNVLGNISNTNLVSSVSEIDFDNDGDFDVFLTRAKHPFDSEADYNTEDKTFYFLARRKPFQHDSIKVNGNLKIENLQMAYPHFDVFIGANKTLFKRTKDQHGHHDLILTQQEAKGWPNDTSKKGLYIGYLGNGYWRIGGFTNAPTTAVIHNVIEAPKTIKLRALPAKLLENRNGKFVDVTAQLGININEQTTSTAVGDFNNDGWADMFVVRYGKSASVIEQFLYLNNNGKAFQLSKTHGIVRNERGSTGMGAEAFDFDKDGDLDIIYANERGKWHLFTNKLKQKNNYVVVNVGSSPSGKASAIGAVLRLQVKNKIYKRVVGATSSSYSQGLNTYLHVGLGDETTVDAAKITWSNGETTSFEIKKLNKTYFVGKSKKQ